MICHDCGRENLPEHFKNAAFGRGPALTPIFIVLRTEKETGIFGGWEAGGRIREATFHKALVEAT